jgi:hypothetical protein
LLTGEAGSGKTHLLCETASTFLKEGVPAIFLMGDQFNNEEPWSQIVKLLGLNASTEDFLGALDAAASASKLRAMIIIDALNEGPGVTFWNRHLTRMLSDVGRYKGIGFCVSVRNGYEGEISAPVTQKFIRCVHQGFARVALEATVRFFEHFKIASPSVPVLQPEFSNPLFLKLFCRATQASGQTNAPAGFHGIKQLFDYYVSAVNAKLSKTDCLDFDPSENRVAQAVQALVRQMIALRTPGVPLQVGRDLLNKIHPANGHSKSLERHLILEGVLARVPYYDSKTGTRQEVLRFPHQRFTDHSIVNALLSDFTKNQRRQLFAAKSSISELLKNSLLGWGRQGFLDALAIQIPERFGVELSDLNTKNAADDEEIQIAFVSSLAWRKPTSITADTKRWAELYRDGSKDGYGKIMTALLNIATCADHPLNAEYLHQILSKQSMGDRDASWSIFVFDEGKEESAVDRLIRWAWSETAHATCSPEVARLGAIGLSWLLTTSQRFVRDEATKALVSLLEKRIPVLQQVLNKFRAVDDPYVTERLYAVAFGCALRTAQMTDLKNLGQQVYDAVFRDEHPLPHVAFRSYAKGVVDIAVNAKCVITFGKGKVTPPYSSQWITALPSLASLRRVLRVCQLKPSRGLL